MDTYTSWMSENEQLKATAAPPNLENFTKRYAKPVDQQSDATYYIRQRLDDLNKVKDHPTITGNVVQNRKLSEEA